MSNDLVSWKDIRGNATLWKGQKANFFRRLIYKLYKRFVNYPFIPEKSSFLIRRYPKVNPKSGKIDSIMISFKNDYPAEFETYIFSEFNRIEE